MIKPETIKSRIIEIIKKRGPSLPVQIAKEVQMNSLFVSAFLSELADDKRIKVSTLKVGGSPLYFLEGQETQLENFFKFLHSKEYEAVQLLKENKILKDSSQDPAIRVALKSIKDFAYNFKNDDELYWRYLTITEQEIRDRFSEKKSETITINEPVQKPIELKPIITQQESIIENNKTFEKEKKIGVQKEKTEEPIIKTQLSEDLKQKVKDNLEEKPREKPKKEHIKKTIQEKKEILVFYNPLAIKPEPKPEKIRPKSEFVLNTMAFLEKTGFKILEEKEFSKKEYLCLAETNTDLGPVAFLTISKDKKSVSDSDLDNLLRKAQSIPLPALYLAPGELTKKAKEYQKKYYSILKFKKIE